MMAISFKTINTKLKEAAGGKDAMEGSEGRPWGPWADVRLAGAYPHADQ